MHCKWFTNGGVPKCALTRYTITSPTEILQHRMPMIHGLRTPSVHIDTIDWSCFGLSCQWSGDNDSVLCRSTETRVVVVPNERAKIVPLKSYWPFWVLQKHGQCSHSPYQLRKVFSGAVLSCGRLLFVYVPTYTGSYKKLWASALLYVLYACIFLHTEFTNQQDSHTKFLSLSSRVPSLKLRKSHSRYRSTSYAKEQSSP